MRKKGEIKTNESIFWKNRIVFAMILLIVTFALSIIFGISLKEKIQRDKALDYEAKLPLDFTQEILIIEKGQKIRLPSIQTCLMNKSQKNCHVSLSQIIPEGCESLKEQKTNCYLEFIKKVDTQEDCEKIPQDFKDKCYLNLAENNFEQEPCKNILNETLREECTLLSEPLINFGEEQS